MQIKIQKIFQLLYNRFGAQHWWPAKTKFEVMIGAILTQQASWKNVEKAINNLRKGGYLSPFSIYKMPVEQLKQIIKPVGFYNMKAKRLKEFTNYFIEKYNGNISYMKRFETEKLREELLALNGIGKETADSILLYALDKETFVVDAYTIRMLNRLGISDSKDYEEIKKLFESSLKKYKFDGYSTIDIFKEMHALIVELGKQYCRKTAYCTDCPLSEICEKKGV